MTATPDVVPTPLFRRHVRRPRLTALLDEATAQSLLVVAPAGYGKTTLAREWLQGREDAVWFLPTPSSADLGAFSAGLVDTVQPVLPGAGERIRQRLRVADDPGRLARPLAEMLAEDLEEWPQGAVIVLDDYHLLAESAPVESFLDRLLLLAPIRLLVTSRRRPGWATARRFLYGEVTEIGRDQLAMTAAEAGQVLEGRSSRAVRALVRQADGWPAVIGLASLSADLEFPEEKASESLFRYFAEEVLRREPPDVQRFMLAASVPLSFGPRLARDVLGFADPEPILARLRDANLVHERGAGELRFHPLVRQFLRHRLESAEPAEFAARAARIVDDARERGRWEEAFELSLESGRADDAARIAGRAARDLLATGQSETLEKWLAACGGSAVTEPLAALAGAELLIRKGEMSTAAAVAEDTVARIPDDHPDHAWACNVTGRALHFTSNEKGAFAMFERGRQAALDDIDAKEALWGLIMTAVEIAPEAMDEYLNELDARYPNDLDVRLRLAVGRYGQAEQTRSITGTWQRFSALLDSVEFSEDPLAASSFLATASAACRLGGRYSASRELASRASKISTELRLQFAEGICLTNHAAAETGLRLFSRAHRTLNAFERTTIRNEDPYYFVEGMTLRARLLASEGRLNEALNTREVLALVDPPPRALGINLATLAIILAAAGQTTAARETARRACDQGIDIEIYYQALVAETIADGMDESRRFVSCVADTVLQCSRASCLDALVLGYRTYPRLLEAAIEDQAASLVIRSLLSESRDYGIAKRLGITVRSSPQDTSLRMLTPREREVLELLALGLGNVDIGRRLHIAPSTVKVHVRHILEKLGAQNRLQALVQGQALLEEI
ncbi:MAG TPA: LuxR C-terminal-related transcriptional regulator [Gaiellaceae bacterium]|nr:LuxR C-terminal-related transcriptional regulator [Gaiellaceae bacterium]